MAFNTFKEGLGTGSLEYGVSLGICVCVRSKVPQMNPWLPFLSIPKRTGVKLEKKRSCVLLTPGDLAS